MATHDDTIRLTEEQIRLLDLWRAQTGLTTEELIAEALRSLQPVPHDATHRTCDESLADRMSRKGLLGCLCGGPPDLSTNPDHMKGIGA